jgi:hypothetical protein
LKDSYRAEKTQPQSPELNLIIASKLAASSHWEARPVERQMNPVGTLLHSSAKLANREWTEEGLAISEK